MLKRLSLQTRLTLLSALVTAGVALALTAISLVSADRIFVRELPQKLAVYEMEAAPIKPESAVPRSAQVSPSGPSDKNGVVYFTPADGGETGETAPMSQVIQISLSKAGRRFNLWGVAGMLLATLLGAGATWFMAGRALRPVRELTAAIEEVGGNDLSRRVEAGGRQDEIGRLADSFNAMMDKLSASFDRQKRFSANAAHELKTPLATIRVGLEVLELDGSPSPQRMARALAVTKTNTERMIRLVDGLFRLSSDMEYEMCETVAFRDLFSEIVSELKAPIKEKRLSVSIDGAPELTLTGNRTMLLRALVNLTENAVKYNREGGSVCLSAVREGEGVAVRVSDTGVGIPAGELSRIFEPFYRVDPSRARAAGGQGLGLTLVKEIIKKHGGTIAVESAPGTGTVFTLRFPFPPEGEAK